MASEYKNDVEHAQEHDWQFIFDSKCNLDAIKIKHQKTYHANRNITLKLFSQRMHKSRHL